MSSLRRGHANLLCIVPILSYETAFTPLPVVSFLHKFESKTRGSRAVKKWAKTVKKRHEDKRKKKWRIRGYRPNTLKKKGTKKSKNLCQKERKNEGKMDSTPHCSRVVPHPSTEQAQTALTSVFGWEPVDYDWYGRIRRTWNLVLRNRGKARSPGLIQGVKPRVRVKAGVKSTKTVNFQDTWILVSSWARESFYLRDMVLT